MAEDDQFGSGVGAVFEAIASERPAEKGPVPSKAAKAPGKAKPPEGTAPPSKQLGEERPAARTGRPPGAKNGPRKEQITGRITSELRNAYVNWSFEERCSLSDLIERALTEFYQRHRAAIDSRK
jgi:hypothetical protein